MKLQRIKEIIKEMFFPSKIKCIICQEEMFKDNKYCVCEECFTNLPFNGDKVCNKCGMKIDDDGEYCLSCKQHIRKPYEKAFAPFEYKNEIIRLIHKLKYSNAKWLAPFISEFLIDCFLKQNINVDLIIPIPLNCKRLKERGYNQAEIICEKFASELNIEIDNKSLIRKRYTQTQTNLTKKERKNNLENAFEVVDKSKIKDKTILLVDDVFTTGATMEEACRTLKKAKCAKIYCLTIAHVKNSILVEK